MPAHPPIQHDALTDAEFRRVSQALHEHSGIELGESKRELVRARLAKELRASGLSSTTDYLDRVLSDRAAGLSRLADVLSTNLTSFFREPDHFDYLSGTHLPALLRAKAAVGDRRLLVWSAACSTGEEACTLAMVLDECGRAAPAAGAAGRPFGGWDVRILATDISTRVLAKARAAAYGAEGLSRVPAALRERNFEPLPDGQFRFSAELGSSVQFKHLNLMDAWPFSGPFDFIFCRNVMIYFDSPTQQGLVGRLAGCLRPGGLLFTGHSESLTGISHGLDHRGPSIYQRRQAARGAAPC